MDTRQVPAGRDSSEYALARRTELVGLGVKVLGLTGAGTGAILHQSLAAWVGVGVAAVGGTLLGLGLWAYAHSRAQVKAAALAPPPPPATAPVSVVRERHRSL